MNDPALALAAAARPVPRAGGVMPRVLVLGGGGALGGRVVERLLAGRRCQAVGVWTVAAAAHRNAWAGALGRS